MNLIGTIVAVLAALAFVVVGVRDFGYRRGFKDGYEAARKAADNWWVGVELQVDQERKKIWREKGEAISHFSW
jgi:hypothetical protein